ncbi:MAG: hypothetical protein ABIY55_25105 [Kofleriaceae bacterium]
MDHEDCCEGGRTRYLWTIEKLTTPEEVVAQIRRMSLEDREFVEAELMRDGYETGRLAEPPSVMDEIVRRANELGPSDEGLSREASIERARTAAREARRRRS